MNWQEITIQVSPEAEEAVSGILYETGVKGVSVEDDTLLEEANRMTNEWDVLDEEVAQRYRRNTALIKAYYPPDCSLEDVKQRILEGVERAKEYLDIPVFEIMSADVAEEDWENNWKQYYKPVPVGKRILIKPLWETLQKTERNVIIELDPGMAFGTGTHETTRMCLELLEKYVSPQKKVLDVGCGSGILSIGAAKLGAAETFAVDIDANAVRIAKENAQVNHVKNEIEVVCGDLTDKVQGTYDIVVANIIADAIIKLSSSIGQFLKEDGIYITSGIILNRLEDVETALRENGFQIYEILREGDWAALVCRKEKQG